MFCGDETKCFTITWKIENFWKFSSSRKVRKMIRCPVWNTENTEGRGLWRLLAVCSNSDVKFFLVNLKGEINKKDYGYQMSILMSSSEVQLKKLKISSNFKCCYNIETNTIFGKNTDLFLPQGTLTLCCRIWQTTLKPGRYLLRNAVYKVNFSWSIEGFSFDSCSYKRSVYQQETMLIQMILVKHRVGESECTHKVILDLLSDSGRVSFIGCSISIKELGHGLARVITSSMAIWDIAINPEKYKDNYLHLEFEALISQDREHQLLPIPSNTLSEDLLHLYKKGMLSDVTLNTEGMSFPAHKNILATRSSVFQAMFEKDQMAEGNSGFVDIKDINSKTMDRFLVFLYSNSIENLHWEEASELYYAADKYAVLTLKQKCAEILMGGLTADNVCDTLFLADKHSDEQLMLCAVDFIRDHNEVISSSAWESLEESNARLTSKVLRQVILKKR